MEGIDADDRVVVDEANQVLTGERDVHRRELVDDQCPGHGRRYWNRGRGSS